MATIHRTHTRLRALVGAGAALPVLVASAAPVFTQVVVFGDSSVDSGAYRALASPGSSAAYNALWPAAVAAGGGIPTSSPGRMYPQVLASYFGLTANPASETGGTNYATSGAKNVQPNTSVNGGFKAAVPTITQIANYLAANAGKADPNALYVVSSGDNDVSFAAGLSGSGPYPDDPTASVTASATSLGNAIASLEAAGAKRFLVARLTASFPLGDVTRQHLRATHNQTLFASLASHGVAVVAADINALRLAINGNPGQYGFTSISNAIGNTACTAPADVTNSWALLCSSDPSAPSTFAAADADVTHLFADDQHFATAAQKLVADYLYGLLTSTVPTGAAPTVSEAFGPPTITSGGASTLVVTLANGSAGAASLTAALTATLPVGVVVAAPPNAATTCGGGGAVAATAGGGTVSLPATRSIPAAGNCNVTVSVTAAAAGSYATAIAAGALATDKGANAAPAHATLAVLPATSNFQGIWWAAPAGSESGWGINFAHQGDTIFATWFTFGHDGKPLWLVVAANRIAPNVYAGNLYGGTGPPFNAVPFDPANVHATQVGTATLLFTDNSAATFAYTVNGISQVKPITRQLFSAPLPTCTWSAQNNLALATNFQDMWWNAPAASESGWGINFAQEGDVIFASWFTFGQDGKPLWLVVAANKQAPKVYAGDLYSGTGPPFDAVPFDPAQVVPMKIGTATLTFADGNNASFSYTVNGIAQTKKLTREVFAAPGTVCQ